MTGVRSYGNALFIENLFKYIPSKLPAFARFARKILNPTVTVVSEDCNTVIGSKKAADDNLIGQIALATGKPITLDYLDSMFKQGVYDIRIRDTESCTATGGICQACLKGLYARLGVTNAIPSVGEEVSLEAAPSSYIGYLADTYSGALVGILPIPCDPLPVNPTILASMITHDEMNSLIKRFSDLAVTQDEIDYMLTISDKFEKALMIVAYYGVYGNASV